MEKVGEEDKVLMWRNRLAYLKYLRARLPIWAEKRILGESWLEYQVSADLPICYFHFFVGRNGEREVHMWCENNSRVFAHKVLKDPEPDEAAEEFEKMVRNLQEKVDEAIENLSV